MNKSQDMLWALFLELRKEVLQAQEIRSKIVGFKLTFLSAIIGLIYANVHHGVNSNLLIVPAVAAIFFDFLINSYSMSTKRIGYYCMHYLEPAFLSPENKPENFLMWESFVNQKKVNQVFSLFGNLGITLIIDATASVNGFITLNLLYALCLMVFLIFLFCVDVYAHIYPRKKLTRIKPPEIDFEPVFK